MTGLNHELRVRQRRLGEVAAIACALVLYVTFQRWIADRWIFVVPVAATLFLGVAAALIWGWRTPAEIGLGRDGLRGSVRWSFAITIPVVATCVVIAIREGIPPTASFWVILAGYPVWAVVQQWIFQGVLHENLLRLGAGGWSVPVVGAAFAAIHAPSTRLVWLGAGAGLVFSMIYRRHRHVVPLGIAHGVCGACIYHFVFRSDLAARFLSAR